MQKNYYVILGVKNTASFDEIKTAYRALAKKYHPDKNHGNNAAEEYFKEIQQAYAVLSNVEKRKKYDLKISYTHIYPKQKPASSGKANQFSQQQPKQGTSQKKSEYVPQKFDYTESWQILVSVGIALLLLYFIISFNTKNEIREHPIAVETSTSVVKEAEPVINNPDSPYSIIFGEEQYDMESKNNIVIHNSDESEVVVCLVQSGTPNKTIRNQYLPWGATFKLNNIPDGNYFLKIYFGNQWDAKKSFLNNKINGGFLNEIGFIKLNTGKDVLKFKQEKIGNTVSYGTFDVTLHPNQVTQTEKIPVEEFFQ
ncbi:MAG: hypothetical protein A3F72_08790 [Bacteroidetes bacterium RIFCSPLOWO2_12_FULL_35_15]|nr:MAG: hypothetical protein A3F72_08790 [Bacteroidetes bacterium RIFCSPLOWO2_12_FULL_35_15]